MYIYNNTMLHSSYSDMVQIKVVTKNKNTYFILSNFFQKLCCLCDDVDKYGKTMQATDYSEIPSYNKTN